MNDGRRLARLLRVALLASTLVATVVVGPAGAQPPRGATWTEHYFPSEDGITMLHADVLRPRGLDEDDKTPVILTVSPYLNHSGQTSGFDPNAEGPSTRFYDFLDLTRILERGYTYVMVDLPGFGGSGGCNDWGGLREQGAVKAAVEWAAAQPWSTGQVGVMGKSYDGWTGLMAMAQRPKGLAAVESMEPVYSGYRYLYNNGVRFINSLVTPAGFQIYDAKPGTTNDDPMYHAIGAPQAWCYGLNYSLQQQDDPDSAFWAERDLLRTTKGVKTPLFLTQGFLETNTKPDGAFDFFNALRGPNRAWFGQFDHYRGWEKDEGGRYLTGRASFVAEMMRFLDRHVRRVPARKAPVQRGRDPAVAVQDNLGRYRAEGRWPPPDARRWWSDLRPGDYEDDGRNSATGPGGGSGIWTFSQPVPHDVWLSGEPVVKLEVEAVPHSNVVANLYDVGRRRATLISRGTSLAEEAGAQEVTFELYGQDWLIPAGHRIAVLVSGANSDWWLHVPTNTTVTVSAAEIGLPFLRHDRTRFIDGRPTSTLRSYLESEKVEVTRGQKKDAQKSFKLPPRLQ